MTDLSPQRKPAKIALADDQTLMRDTLGKYLDSFDQYNVILLAGNGRELIDNIDPHNLPDLVILDLNMPILNGYEAAQWLRDNHPSVYVLALTVIDSDFAFAMLHKLGVRGVLQKDLNPEEFRKAIDQTISTGDYHSSHAARRAVRLLNNIGSKQSTTGAIILSGKMIRFLELARTEMTYKEIALEMKVSHRTVDYYRDELFKKWQVRGRTALVEYAIKNGVII